MVPKVLQRWFKAHFSHPSDITDQIVKPDSWDNWVSGIDLTTVKESEDIIARIIQQASRPHAKPDADDTALPAFGSKGRQGNSSGNQTRRDG
jgi:hypothetical protein